MPRHRVQPSNFTSRTTREAGRSFRVSHDRTLSLDPYDDGFGIMKDTQTAKPQVFRTGDGWFAYNLATNLAQM